MKLRVVTLAWDPKNQVISESRLIAAVGARDVLGYDTHWMTTGGKECLVLTLRLDSDGAAPVGGEGFPSVDRSGVRVHEDGYVSTPRRDSKGRNPFYDKIITYLKSCLTPIGEKKFQEMRSWRAAKTPKGKAPFAIANDRHLLEFILHAPKTVEEIKAIQGVRKALYTQYADEVLEFTKDIAPVEYEIPSEWEPERKMGGSAVEEPAAEEPPKAEEPAAEVGIDDGMLFKLDDVEAKSGKEGKKK